MSKLLDLLLGFCAHNRYTFPISLKPGQHGPEAARLTGVYVVCLDCAKEFAYSWEEMRVVSRWEEMRVVSRPSREKPPRTTTVEAFSTETPLGSSYAGNSRPI